MHFTYDENSPKDCLQQGDLLKKTDQLSEVIQAVHPHYAKEEYTHFQVVTQSCDLVLRGKSKKCATRYITLAAVRKLSTVVEREIDTNVGKDIISVTGWKAVNEKHRDRLISFITSLLNNNDKNHFYLEPVPDFGLNDPSCTFLKLSISIKAKEHYQTCLDAKIIGLKEIFQSKLGWLIGQMYSRVGTPDYTESDSPESENISDKASKILDDHVFWVSRKTFAQFKGAAKETAQPNPPFENILDEATNRINKKAEETLDKVINSLLQVDSFHSLPKAEKNQLKKKLKEELIEKNYIKNLIGYMG